MRLLVCGGRTYDNHHKFNEEMAELGLEPSDIIISGGAKGADTMAIEYAKEWDHPYTVYLADWKTHGKAAGPIRNQHMLETSQPDLVLAFPGGKGTADMVRRARQAGVEVHEIN